MSLDSASTTDQLGPLIGDDFNLDFVLPIISLIVIMTLTVFEFFVVLVDVISSDFQITEVI